MKKQLIISCLTMLALNPISSKAEDTVMDQFAKDFKSSRLHDSLAKCEFKVAWELLRDFDKIEDDKFGSSIAVNCFEQIQATSKILTPPLMVGVVFNFLAFIKKKIKQDGKESFQIYEDFEYSGELKKDVKPKE